MLLSDLVQQSFQRAAAQDNHSQHCLVLEADFDFFEPVGDHHLKVDRHVHVEHIDGSDVLGQERGLLAGQPLSRLQQEAELLDHFLGQSPIGRCAVGRAWRIVAEVFGQAPVLKHVDGEPCELGVRECGPQVPQDLGFGSVMKGVGVDANAVVHEVSEGVVRVVQDVSAAHLEQVLELLPQRVISDGHGHQPFTAHSTMNDGLTGIRPFCFTYGPVLGHSPTGVLGSVEFSSDRGAAVAPSKVRPFFCLTHAGHICPRSHAVGPVIRGSGGPDMLVLGCPYCTSTSDRSSENEFTTRRG